MLFNSFVFAIFLPTVFVLYWALSGRRLRAQNILLLVASYVFYGWWDWRFLTLIFASSAVDYLVGMGLSSREDRRTRRWLLAASLIVNLGLLGFFKYYGFFVDSLADLLRTVGFDPHVRTLRIVLPVGISFYTFQTLSYTIDVYRRQIQPTRDIVAFFAFVSFFPQLVAGPIERAKNLLPQFQQPRRFDPDSARDGARQMLWGLFKKVVVADRLGRHVETIYSGYAELDTLTLIVGTLFFAIQIYGDFSGYSDIAIGAARLFGFNLMRNFAFPYFSRDIAEFWGRWHISLSTWFQDYVYIPLGGSRVTRGRQLRNVIITFVLSGFWHGANWTFVAWGLLNGLYYIPLIFAGRRKRHADVIGEGRLLPPLSESLQMVATFLLTLFAWIFFRAESIDHAFSFIRRLITAAELTLPTAYARPLVYVVVLLAVEWIQRSKQHALQVDGLPAPARWLIYYAVLAALFMYGVTGHVPFIYFQF